MLSHVFLNIVLQEKNLVRKKNKGNSGGSEHKRLYIVFSQK